MTRSGTKRIDAFRWRVGVASLILGAAIAATCGQTAEAESAPKPRIDKARATVNDVPIDDAAVQERLRAYLRRIGHRTLSESRMAALEQHMLKQLIEEELLFQEGRRRGVVVAESEIEDGVRRIRDRFSSDTDFEAALMEAALKPTDVRRGVARALLIEKTWAIFAEQAENDRRQQLEALIRKATIVTTTADSGDGAGHQ